MNLFDPIVLITSVNPDQKRFGTGFVVHREGNTTYILTCTHVVEDVDGFKKIQIEGLTGTTIAFDKADGADLAVLSVNGLMNKPILRMEDYGRSGMPFVTIGFQKYGTWFKVGKLKGNIGDNVQLVRRDEENRVKAWNLQMEENNDLQHGYSGSPVIDVRNGNVIAVISARKDDGKIGLGISIEAVKRIWPPIASPNNAQTSNGGISTPQELITIPDPGISIIVLRSVKELAACRRAGRKSYFRACKQAKKAKRCQKSGLNSRFHGSSFLNFVQQAR